MPAWKRIIAACIVVGAYALPCAAQEVEEAKISQSSAEFLNSSAESMQKFEQDGFGQGLQTGSLGAMPGGEFDDIVQEMTSGPEIEGVSLGETSQSYDVIIQPGHYKRISGATGAQGKIVSERQLVAYIVRIAAEEMRAAGLDVLVVPADGTRSPLKAKVFLSVHADGNEKGCTVGPSLAYKDKNSTHAMHAVGFALARAFGYDYAEFMRDGYTANSAKYYMFGRVEAPLLAGLLEVGELTCEGIERHLISTSPVIGENIATALKYIVTLENGGG